MTSGAVVDLARESLWLVLTLSLPALLSALAVGLLTGLLQTVTQIQDAALSTVPRLVVVTIVVALCLPWMFDQLASYADRLLGSP